MHHHMFMQLGAISSAPQVEEAYSIAAVTYLCTIIIQWMKWNESKFTAFINQHTPWMTRVIVAGTSAFSAAGIHKLWNPTTGTIGLTGISVWAILHALKYVVVNYAAQHAWWKILYSNMEDVKRGILENLPKPPVTPSPEPPKAMSA